MFQRRHEADSRGEPYPIHLSKGRIRPCAIPRVSIRPQASRRQRNLAVEALAFLAADETRLERFLAVTGLGPHNLRRAAADPGFLVSVLDYLAGDERLLVAFAAEKRPPAGRRDAGVRGASRAAAGRRTMSDAAGPILAAILCRAILCRDCLARRSRDAARCPSCGSPRAVDLEAAAGLDVAHVDCDAFYASVEKRDDPALARQAADRRRVGAARRGLDLLLSRAHLWRALGHADGAGAGAYVPDAVVLPPDMAKYARVGREIRALMQGLTPLVEPLSIDEAFLDLSGCEGANGAGAAETLARFARRVEREVGVTVSVGLSYCKFLAKMASDLDKPRGFAGLAPGGGEGLARAAGGRPALGRRQGGPAEAGAAGFPADRRSSAGGRGSRRGASRRRRAGGCGGSPRESTIAASVPIARRRASRARRRSMWTSATGRN